MEWFLKVVRDNYANFEGRARRKEFWMFILWEIIIMVPIAILAGIGQAMDMSFLALIANVAYYVIAIGLFVPGLAVAVRRLHDTGRSGWFYLLGLIPIANFLLLFWLVSEGDEGPNEYGEDPKAGEPR